MCATRDVDGSILRSKPHLYATARQVTPFCFCHVPRPVLTLLQPVRSAATGSISYHSSKSSMKRKSAIVTGSASGIGQALVEQLVSREGYKALTVSSFHYCAITRQFSTTSSVLRLHAYQHLACISHMLASISMPLGCVHVLLQSFHWCRSARITCFKCTTL